MGIGFRVFLVGDDDSLDRLPMARYERLRHRDPGESLPKYAGKRVRCALIILEVARRTPLFIRHIQYSFVAFDTEGKIDITEREKEARLVIQALPPLTSKEGSQHVIDARWQFAKKRYEDEFKWTPTPEIRAAIVAAIFREESA